MNTATVSVSCVRESSALSSDIPGHKKDGVGSGPICLAEWPSGYATQIFSKHYATDKAW
jgi:hypothetical protein